MKTVRCPLQTGDEGAALLSYLDRRMDAESTAALDRHVAACPECARVVEAQRHVWAALDQWEPVAARAGFDDAVLARIAAEEQHPLSLWRRLSARVTGANGGKVAWWKPAIPVAAACAVLLAVVAWRGPAAPVLQPETGVSAAVMGLDNTEAQQVEEVLSDLEMLHALGLTEAAGGAPVPSAPQSL